MNQRCFRAIIYLKRWFLSLSRNRFLDVTWINISLNNWTAAANSTSKSTVCWKHHANPNLESLSWECAKSGNTKINSNKLQGRNSRNEVVVNINAFCRMFFKALYKAFPWKLLFCKDEQSEKYFFKLSKPFHPFIYRSFNYCINFFMLYIHSKEISTKEQWLQLHRAIYLRRNDMNCHESK